MKLIASDYDGTLRPHGQTGLFPGTEEAIRRWQQAGNLFGLCSGRAVSSARNELEKYGIKLDFLIAGSGSAVTVGAEWLAKHPMPGSAAVQLLQLAEKMGTDRYIAHNQNSELLIYMPLNPERCNCTKEAVLNAAEVLQIAVAFPAGPETANDFVRRAEETIPGVKAHINGIYIDCTVSSVNKGTGVEEVRRHFGLSPRDCICVGDQQNDLSMLKRFEGYCMADGDPVTIEKTGRTAESVAALIERLL